jgi:hypothetical protein
MDEMRLLWSFMLRCDIPGTNIVTSELCDYGVENIIDPARLMNTEIIWLPLQWAGI